MSSPPETTFRLGGAVHVLSKGNDMDEATRAKQIAQAIQEAMDKPIQGNYSVLRHGGCASCDPGSCPECGFLFTGEVITIDHKIRGKRTLSDRTIHYLSHGITHYQTGYVVRGEPVVVDLNLDELAGYLDL
jgi:hypothetical protein